MRVHSRKAETNTLRSGYLFLRNGRSRVTQHRINPMDAHALPQCLYTRTANGDDTRQLFTKKAIQYVSMYAHQSNNAINHWVGTRQRNHRHLILVVLAHSTVASR